MRAQSLQLCQTLCDPMEPARLLILWGFSRILEYVAISFLLQGNFLTQGLSPALAGGVFTTSAT